MSALLELADRCEAAAGPDRELDCAIAVAAAGYHLLPPKWEGGPVGYGYHDADGTEVRPGHGGDRLVKRYTASLDAAMSLVPEGVRIDTLGEWDAECLRAMGVWTAVLCERRKAKALSQSPHAATPALALCAAALRARNTISPLLDEGGAK